MISLIPAIVLVATLPAFGADYAPRPDLDAGRYLKALADAEALLRREPGNALAWAAKSQALTALVRLPEAMSAANRAVELQSDLADAHLALGLALGGAAVKQKSFGSLAKVSRAMDELRTAVKTDPTPWTLRTAMSPPRRTASRREISRPRPVPPKRRATEASD